MAIDRFTDKNILTTIKSPVESVEIYSLEDKVNLSFTPYPLQTRDYDTQCQLEAHTYSGDKLIQSNTTVLPYELNTTDEGIDTNILVKPEKDVRLATSEAGNYSLVYNFLDPCSPMAKVKNINADNTEIELEIRDNGTTFSKLFNKINSNSDTIYNLGLNFGSNNISVITGVSFENNSRIGEKVQAVFHPTDSYQNESTFFSPIQE